jgi:hypothetical protein
MSKYMAAFLVLMIAWFCGWILFHITGGFIHILLVAAVVSLILHFILSRRAEADVRFTP